MGFSLRFAAADQLVPPDAPFFFFVREVETIAMKTMMAPTTMVLIPPAESELLQSEELP